MIRSYSLLEALGRGPRQGAIFLLCAGALFGATNSASGEPGQQKSEQNSMDSPVQGVAEDPAKLDGDGDLVLGENDKCPDKPEDIDQYQDADGCPDYDNDEDGIRDAEDKCPNEKEVINTLKDGDGCPDGKAEQELLIVSYKDVRLKSDEPAFFKGKGTKLGRKGKKVLKQLASALKNYRQIELLVIRGYGEPKGSKRRNLKIAKRRAEAVLKYLVKRGVSSKRLQASGVGEVSGAQGKQGDVPKPTSSRIEFEVLGYLTQEELIHKQQLEGESAALPPFKPKPLAVKNKLGQKKHTQPLIKSNAIELESIEQLEPSGIRRANPPKD